ncbi:MAG: erythromycin esterase family protein [bacterium]
MEEKNTFLNLDFEVGVNYKPKNWIIEGKGYTLKLDPLNAYHGKNGLRITKYGEGRFGTAGSILPINSVKGKHILYTGYIKTLNVNTGYAGLWMRVDSNNASIKLENMNKYGAKGLSIWTRYSIEMDINEGAQFVCFGVLLDGDGTAWFDSLNIYVDGKLFTDENYKPFIPTKEEYDWIKTNAVKLSTVEPNSNFDDIAPLKPIFDEAEIISLGEGTHGTSEFFKMKDRLVRFITQDNKNAVFAIEANMPEARLLNDYIQTGKGDAKKLLDGLYFWTWNTQEVLDMIEWMKDYNLSGKGNIEFWGFDMQTPTIALKNIAEFISKNEPAYSDSVNNLNNIITDCYEQLMRNYKNQDKNFAKKWYNAANILSNHLNKNRSQYLKLHDSTIVSFLIQDSKIVLQGAETFLYGYYSRDFSMAQNIIWIKEHIAKDKKLILWAHNGHVTKGKKMMGDYLFKEYGNKMFVVGFCYYDGSYTTNGVKGLEAYSTDLPKAESIEWILHNIGIKNIFLNIRNISNTPNAIWLNDQLNIRDIGSYQPEKAFYPLKLPECFDALIFIDKTTPTKLLKEY